MFGVEEVEGCRDLLYSILSTFIGAESERRRGGIVLAKLVGCWRYVKNVTLMSMNPSMMQLQTQINGGDCGVQKG